VKTNTGEKDQTYLNLINKNAILLDSCQMLLRLLLLVLLVCPEIHLLKVH
jgi:hypothetical protein